MKGDYHRYLAEFKTGNERKEAAENTLNAYKAAQDIANSELAPTHPICLGLALNFSEQDIANSKKINACHKKIGSVFLPSQSSQICSSSSSSS